MTKRIKKKLAVLDSLSRCNRKDQECAIKAANDELVQAVCDCITNVLYGRVKLSDYQRRKLKPKKHIWRELVKPKKSTKEKKKLLVQHGSGILGLLLKPVIGALLGGA